MPFRMLGLTEAARLGTSQAELKDGTTRVSGFCRANVLWNLSLPRRIQITSKRRLSFSIGTTTM
ncbi:hypothetical protein YC2023_017629 [Brassica napus]